MIHDKQINETNKAKLKCMEQIANKNTNKTNHKALFSSISTLKVELYLFYRFWAFTK